MFCGRALPELVEKLSAVAGVYRWCHAPRWLCLMSACARIPLPSTEHILGFLAIHGQPQSHVRHGMEPAAQPAHSRAMHAPRASCRRARMHNAPLLIWRRAGHLGGAPGELRRAPDPVGPVARVRRRCARGAGRVPAPGPARAAGARAQRRRLPGRVRPAAAVAPRRLLAARRACVQSWYGVD